VSDGEYHGELENYVAKETQAHETVGHGTMTWRGKYHEGCKK
jgi:hypothetical protein